MTQIVGLFLLFLGGFTLYCGLMFRNEVFYRKFLTGYMKLFGIDVAKIPSTSAVPDPLKPHVVQGRMAGYMFIGLAVFIFGVAGFLFLLN